MKSLRRIHLYLGCVFAPMLTFFALSGMWQMFFAQSGKTPNALSWLSTIHTGRRMKAPADGIDTLSSPYLRWVIAAMAVSLLITIVLGVVMAFKFGHAKAAFACLTAGIATPCLLVLAAVYL